MTRTHSLPPGSSAALPLALATAGCDPVVNVYGSFFPAWVVSLIAGALITVLLRPILLYTRLEAHLGPLILFYPSLTFLLTCLIWLLFFRT
jgi:hypothetical protein